eukprot:SAG31_NODE_6161_length_2143_cov_2.048434_2_plen_78_part_00
MITMDVLLYQHTSISIRCTLDSRYFQEVLVPEPVGTWVHVLNLVLLLDQMFSNVLDSTCTYSHQLINLVLVRTLSTN